MFTRPIHPFVDVGVVFPHDYMEGKDHRNPYNVYLILDAPYHYAAIVLDMNHDLHVYTLPESRNQGLMRKALHDVILPHLLKSRRSVRITIDKNESSPEATFLAKKLGFKRKSAGDGTTVFSRGPIGLPTFKEFEFPISLEKEKAIELQTEAETLMRRLTQIYMESLIGLGDRAYLKDFQKYKTMIDDLFSLSHCIFWNQKDAKDDESELESFPSRSDMMMDHLRFLDRTDPTRTKGTLHFSGKEM